MMTEFHFRVLGLYISVIGNNCAFSYYDNSKVCCEKGLLYVVVVSSSHHLWHCTTFVHHNVSCP